MFSFRFTEEPSEEEKEEMDKLEANASGEGTEDSNGDLANLKNEAAKLEWNLSSKVGIRSATEDAVALLKKYNAKIPEDATKAKQKVGPVLLAHKQEKVEDIFAALWKELGKKVSQEEQAEKDKTFQQVTKVDANAGLVAAFKELSELYAKEGTYVGIGWKQPIATYGSSCFVVSFLGNRQAVFTYSKLLDAIQNLDYEITADNAIAMSKGKTKVDGVGKASAEKIKEFCETGTMQKLEEKRQDLA